MRSSLVGLIVLTALLAIAPAADAQSPPVLPGTQGDFAGLVDIGGRKLYLECRGRGSPTVILVAGKDDSARYWTDDLLPANPPRTMVFPTIATTTRVCAYDRPGTYAFIGQESFISRSDPVAQPTTAMARVAEAPNSGQPATSPPVQSPPVITKKKLDAALDQLPGIVRAAMRRTGIPGVAVAVVRHDKPVFMKGFGVREAGKPDRITPDTVFQLASTAKPIASTVVAGVVGQQKLAWDDPVVRYTPAFALGDPYVTQNVTVADLFSHRSGLPAQVGDYLQYLGYDRDYVLSHLRLEPLSPFRAGFAYTNFGLTAAAVAAATAAGTNWEDLAEQVLYQPLGMTSTSSRFADYAKADNKALTHVKIGRDWVAKFTFDDDAASPAGGVSTTLRDFTKWMRLQLGNGMFDGKQVIDGDALARTHLPAIMHMPPAAPAGRASFYGLGWNVGYDALGRLTLDHSGEFLAGAGTTVNLLPTEQLGVAVLTNASAIGAAEAIAYHFLDVATYGQATVDWLPYFLKLLGSMHASGPDYSKPPANAAPAQPDSTYVGTYANDNYGPLSVVAKDSGLLLQLGPKNLQFPLTHYDGNTFSYVPFAELGLRSSVTFTVSDDTPTASRVTIGLLDEDGLGTFTRTPDGAQ